MRATNRSLRATGKGANRLDIRMLLQPRGYTLSRLYPNETCNRYLGKIKHLRILTKLDIAISRKRRGEAKFQPNNDS
ncbi:hypothetical protein PAJ34TS1_62440 [Paenibacillus azoreducens]|uniref:Uncharacterized protein n=1 Tax=Paenibacillus azoreducens TaxID=116718 RepID=A0A920CUF9_9BACL|nr:hypothetical protein J34TS1_50540 [Paenibacillus azoreducens]